MSATVEPAVNNLGTFEVDDGEISAVSDPCYSQKDETETSTGVLIGAGCYEGERE